MFNSLITTMVRREFARVMRFEEGNPPEIPLGDAKPRLLYLHIPFCEKLCPYCSFHRIPFQASVGKQYFDALRKEILLYKKRGYNFRGVYVGGGTPTVMIDELEQTLMVVRECFNVKELSVETNPNHLTDGNIAILKRVGVNRLSVGIQSFDDDLLKAMDRYDKYGSGQAIAKRLKETLGQFETLNADMMFNFPRQNPATLDRDLTMLLDVGPDQITYYPLMASDSTRTLAQERLGNIDYRQEEKLYQQIVRRLMPPYMFSSAWCFSQKKTKTIIDEYIVDYDEYAGLGSGAIGYLQGTCYANTFDIERYIDIINGGGSPLFASRDFTLRDKTRYDFLMKLFSTRMDVSALQKKYDGMFYRHIWQDILAFYLLGGLYYDAPYLCLTRRGYYLWVIMMREFFIAVNNFRDFCRHGAAL